MDDDDLRSRVKELEDELEALKTRVEKLEQALETEREPEESDEPPSRDRGDPEVPRPRDSLTDEWAEDVREGIPEAVRREPYEGGGRYPRRGWRGRKLNVPPVAGWIRFTVAVAVVAAAVALFQLAGRRIVGEMMAAGLALGMGFALIVIAELWGRRLLQVEVLMKGAGFVGGFAALVTPSLMGAPPTWVPEAAVYSLAALAFLMASAFLFALKDGYATLACEAVAMGYAGALLTMDGPDEVLAAAALTTLSAGAFIYLRRWRAVAYVALAGSLYTFVRTDAAEFEIQLAYLGISFVIYSLVALSLAEVDSRRIHTVLVDVLDSGFLLVNASAYAYFTAPLVMEEMGGYLASAAVASAAAVYAAVFLRGSGRSRALARSTPYLTLALVAAAAVYGLPGDLAVVAAVAVATGVYIGTRSNGNRDWMAAATLLHWFAAVAAAAVVLELTRPAAADVVGPAVASALTAAALVGVLADSDGATAPLLRGFRFRACQAGAAAFLLLLASWLVFDGVLVTAAWAAAAAAFVAVGGSREADVVVQAGHLSAAAAFVKLLAFDSRAVDSGVGLAFEGWLLGSLMVAASLYISYGAGVVFEVFGEEARYRWSYPSAGGVAFAAAAALELPGFVSTAAWTLFAAAALASGVWIRREELVVVALSLLAAAAAKLVLFDSVGLPSAVRAVLAVAVAASAVAGVFVYLRYKREILDLLRWNERS